MKADDIKTKLKRHIKNGEVILQQTELDAELKAKGIIRGKDTRHGEIITISCSPETLEKQWDDTDGIHKEFIDKCKGEGLV